MTNDIISSKIKELRTSQNLTQVEFAESINTTQAALSGYERGDRTPSLDILDNISQKYKVSVDWLLGLSDTIDVNDTPRTYSDIIRILFKLESANLANFSIRAYCNDYSQQNVCEFSTSDSSIFNFATEWKKIKELHDSRTIDDELYNLWLEKTLKKYDKPIVHPLNGFMNIPDGIEDELPFA